METSRIVVKNLPKYVTKERLKEHFKQIGTPTDLKLVTTKSGMSRRFAYIGFKTNEQGLEAVSYFNNTYMDTAKLTVEVAKSIGDESIARPWSKYSQGSSANNSYIASKEKKGESVEEVKPVDKKLSKKAQKFLDDIDEEDPELKEFLEVMRPRNAAASRTWGNDDVVAAHASKHATITPIIADPEDDLYQDLPLKLDESAEDELMEDDQEIQEEVTEDKAAFDSTLSDMDYLRMKMKQAAPTEAEEEAPKTVQREQVKVHPGRMAILQDGGAIDSDVVNTYVEKEKDAEEAEMIESVQMAEIPAAFETPSPDLIADTGRIMVRNLAYSCTYEDIEERFKTFGPINEIHLPIDKITKEAKGYAFITYMLPEHAVAAFSELDQSIFQGRILEIVAAKEKPQAIDELPSGPVSFKDKREKAKKSSASNDFNWNSLFMNSDAVAEAMAQKLGVRKSEILDTEAENMAVRLALAETSVINDTKKYLEEEGVDLDSFAGKRKRSATIILVKNIPFSTTEDDLLTLFGKFGTLGRVILPPARTISLVEFSERNEAKVAFRRLAYSKFKNLPLYLEWAPFDTFTSEYDPEVIAKRKAERAAAIKAEESNIPAAEVVKIAGDDDVQLPAVATVFVKNLNFDTSDDGLKAAFESLDGLKSARVSTKPNPKNPGTRLSMGFGFLEFDSKESAMNCIKSMQKFVLDGHELNLKFSNAASKPSSNRKRNIAEVKENSTKLMVRNLPFEATKKDLKQLFMSFGSVKTVRIPRKFDGQHRGFGFVDFLTAQEAKSAFDALGATHLYGRHLVIEYAKEEESVAEVRERTAKAFAQGGGKKRKIDEEQEDFEAYD